MYKPSVAVGQLAHMWLWEQCVAGVRCCVLARTVSAWVNTGRPDVILASRLGQLEGCIGLSGLSTPMSLYFSLNLLNGCVLNEVVCSSENMNK